MFIEQGSALVGLIGGLAFVVSVLIQAIKNLPWLRRIPTDAVVIVLSLLLTLAALLTYADTTALELRWYMLVAVLPVGFVVSFVAMYGWATARDLWQRLALRGEVMDDE
jgi:hypothetical protein